MRYALLIPLLLAVVLTPRSSSAQGMHTMSAPSPVGIGAGVGAASAAGVGAVMALPRAGATAAVPSAGGSPPEAEVHGAHAHAHHDEVEIPTHHCERMHQWECPYGGCTTANPGHWVYWDRCE